MCIGIHWPNVYCKHVREKKWVPISLAPGLHAYLYSMCAGGGGGGCMYLVSSRQLRSAQCNFNPIQPHPHPPSSAELVRLVILCSAAVGLRHHVINACRVVKLLRGRGRNNSRHARPQELVIIHEPGGG